MDHRIETFLSVVQHRSYTKAAEELHITQPAVSQHIRHLEKKYGVKLFCLEGKRLHLTDEGVLLATTMKRIRNDERAMERRMHLAASGRRRMVFGVTKTIGEFVILNIVAAFVKRHPETDIRMVSGNTQELLAAIDEGEIDFALVEGYFDKDRYACEFFGEEEFIAAAGRDYVFRGSGEGLEELLKERLIVREPGSGTREILERYLAFYGLTAEDFEHTIETGQMRAVIGLLERGAGISFLYRIAVRRELAAGTVRELPLGTNPLTHRFMFVWQRESAFQDEYLALSREFKEIGGRA